MKRREVIRAFGVLTFGMVIERTSSTLDHQPVENGMDARQLPGGPVPATVAGVRLVDSKVAKEATELSRTVSPPYLFNHAIRTYLFGSLVGRSLGQTFDAELLYLACIFHDLGLTDKYAGDLPFEIQGAEVAKRFLEEHAYDKAKIGVVWDGIAMHPLSIGHYKRPEIALVGEGAGADVLGPDSAQISNAEVDEVVKAFPRLRFNDSFIKTCADLVHSHPCSASRTFVRDIGERYVPEFHPRNICDLMQKSPFQE